MKNQKQEREPDFNNLKGVWDEYAEIYEVLPLTRAYQDMAKKLIAILESCPSGIVLDGGCGSGEMLEKIIETTGARKIIASDWSEEMLNKAKKK